jgi:hypothetical protein
VFHTKRNAIPIYVEINFCNRQILLSNCERERDRIATCKIVKLNPDRKKVGKLSGKKKRHRKLPSKVIKFAYGDVFSHF